MKTLAHKTIPAEWPLPAETIRMLPGRTGAAVSFETAQGKGATVSRMPGCWHVADGNGNAFFPIYSRSDVLDRVNRLLRI